MTYRMNIRGAAMAGRSGQMGLSLKDIGLMDRTWVLASLRPPTTKCMRDYGYRINRLVFVYSVELTVVEKSRQEMV